jgi:hypothetical protein
MDPPPPPSGTNLYTCTNRYTLYVSLILSCTVHLHIAVHQHQQCSYHPHLCPTHHSTQAPAHHSRHSLTSRESPEISNRAMDITWKNPHTIATCHTPRTLKSRSRPPSRPPTRHKPTCRLSKPEQHTPGRHDHLSTSRDRSDLPTPRETDPSLPPTTGYISNLSRQNPITHYPPPSVKLRSCHVQHSQPRSRQ